ncbi:MAG: 3-oxoadipate enol-lactonase [Pseudomonadota bacterium]
MHVADLQNISLNYRIDGAENGAPVVFVNSLGTDYRLWDKILPLLPMGLRFIRYDKRGHGLSGCPEAPYSMGTLVGDLAKLLDHLEIRDAVVVGCSIGGLIAQGLAVKRMDQVRAMVLSNTGAKIGTKEMWADRIEAVKAGGIEALAPATLERWFSAKFRSKPELVAWNAMLTRTPSEGYIGCSSAIANTDFYETTASLTLPTLAIAGSEDGSTPPDLVRETAALVKGSKFELIRGAGHLPMVEAPERFAEILTDFLNANGHSRP